MSYISLKDQAHLCKVVALVRTLMAGWYEYMIHGDVPTALFFSSQLEHVLGEIKKFNESSAKSMLAELSEIYAKGPTAENEKFLRVAEEFKTWMEMHGQPVELKD